MQKNFDSTERLLEYTMGMSSRSHKYLSRLGAPGRYIYIYPGANLGNMSNKGRLAYQRHMLKAKRFLMKIKNAYNANGFTVRPTSWHTAMINVRNKDGLNMLLHVNLTKQQILSYRKQSDGKSKWAQVPTYRRNGIYRNKL
jgi:hypothetical protein